MAFAKLLNLFAVSSLAVLVCNFAVEPVSALSVDSHGMVNMKRGHGHNAVAKHKRQSTSSKRCKPRSASSAAPASTAPPATTTAAAPPASSSSSSSSSSGGSGSSGSGSSGSTGGSGKVCLAWGSSNDQIAGILNSNVKYLYNWGPDIPSNCQELGINCIPMLWSDDSSKVSAFNSVVQPGYANYILGFNEIDQSGQANMNVQQTIDSWQANIQPKANEGFKLLAPVTSSAPVGFDMIKQFVDGCNGCTIDGFPVHYYGTNATAMIEYIEQWHTQFQKPIWVTEFACQNYNPGFENNGQQCSESQVWDFYTTIINYMESTSFVEAYCPFGFMSSLPDGVNDLDRLLNSDGSLTDLGSAIINKSL